MSPERLWRLSIVLHRKGAHQLAKRVKQLNSALYHNSLATGARIGNGLYLGHHGLGVVVHDNVEIGEQVTIWQNVTLAVRAPQESSHRIIVEDDVMIGANAVVITPLHRSLRIGAGAKVGAGAVVTRDVPPGATVVGVPARIVRTRPTATA